MLKGFYQGLPFNFSLPLVATFTDRLTLLGSEMWLWSADLVRADGQLWVCRLSVPLLGLTLGDKFYLDIAPSIVPGEGDWIQGGGSQSWWCW